MRDETFSQTHVSVREKPRRGRLIQVTLARACRKSQGRTLHTKRKIHGSSVHEVAMMMDLVAVDWMLDMAARHLDWNG